MISIIVPTFNEETSILNTLKSLERFPTDQFEVIVSDGGSSDNTQQLVKEFSKSASFPISLIIEKSLSRAVSMNIGAREAKGDTLIFLHADTLLPEKAFELIKKALGQKDTIGGGFTIRFDSSSFWIKVIQARSNLRIKWFHVIFGDQTFYLRREVFEDLGGFDDVPLMEDLRLSKAMRHHPGKIHIIQTPVTSSARRILANGPLRTMFTYNYLSIAYFFGKSPEDIAEMYKRLKKS